MRSPAETQWRPPRPAGTRSPARDAPAAPDGSDRQIGSLRQPEPAAVRGPAAGVPDLTDLGLADVLSTGHAGKGTGGGTAASDVAFQHASERGFALLLDYYGIAWDYEPDSFPIEWDQDQWPVGWFRPDFYLPAFDTYIEITTSAQRLVTRKNRKLRLLRQHHPDVRCKLFYQRDYAELVRRFQLDGTAPDPGDAPPTRAG